MEVSIHRAGPVSRVTKMTIHRASPVSRVTKTTIHRAGPVSNTGLSQFRSLPHPNPMFPLGPASSSTSRRRLRHSRAGLG